MNIGSTKPGRVGLVGLLLLALTLAGVGPAHAVVAMGSISGTITAPSGTDFSRFKIGVVDQDNRSTSAVTDITAKGVYRIGNLPAGSYKVTAVYPAGGMLEGYFGGNGSYDAATVITLAGGQAVAGKNITVVKEATISGKLTAPPSVDVTEVQIGAALVDVDGGLAGWAMSAQANKDGTFKLRKLPAGSYKIQLIGSSRSGALDQWYPQSDSIEGSPAFTIQAGQNVVGVNDTLVKGGNNQREGVVAGRSPRRSSGSDTGGGRQHPECRWRREPGGGRQLQDPWPESRQLQIVI